MGVIDIAEAIISRASQRVDLSAQNLANVTTPGYKARTQFAPLLTAEGAFAIPQNGGVDFIAGKLQITGNPLDLAIAGTGFFAVRARDTTYYTRSGQFERDAQDRFVTPEGLVLQAESGDVTVASPNFAVLEDGTVLED